MNKYIKMFMEDNNLKVGDEFRKKGTDAYDIWHFNEDGRIENERGIGSNKLLVKFMLGEYEVEKVKKEPWKPKLYDYYFFVSDCGNIEQFTHEESEIDNYIFTHSLVFKTEEEAEDYKWFLDKVDEYKKPFKYRDDNFCFYYDHDVNELSKLNLKQTCYQGTIYFGGLENIENFLKEVGEDRVKKYWFNIWE